MEQTNEAYQRYLLALQLSQSRDINPDVIERAGELDPQEAETKLKALMTVVSLSKRSHLVMSFAEYVPAGDLVEIAKQIKNREQRKP